MNPENTVFDAKRLIGRNLMIPIFQADIKNFPFKVVNDGNNKPIIQVNYKGEEKKYRPESAINGTCENERNMRKSLHR